tara:strand:+ start:3361 stop:3621 length:261 start_codon:yes stop_codon:yes gene_type:complete
MQSRRRDVSMLQDARRLHSIIVSTISRRQWRRAHRLLRDIVSSPSRLRNTHMSDDRIHLRAILYGHDDVVQAFDSYMTLYAEFPEA